MNIEVVPAAITQIDTSTYRRLTRPEARLDQYYIETDSLMGYLASLVKDGDPRNAIRNVNYILKHVSASFYVCCDEKDIKDLMLFTGLTVTWVREELYLVSGRLDEWKSAAIDLCNLSFCMKTRYILNCCVLYIEKAGLMEVFGNYSKRTQPDQTFIFQRKE